MQLLKILSDLSLLEFICLRKRTVSPQIFALCVVEVLVTNVIWHYSIPQTFFILVTIEFVSIQDYEQSSRS